MDITCCDSIKGSILDCRILERIEGGSGVEIIFPLALLLMVGGFTSLKQQV